MKKSMFGKNESKIVATAGVFALLTLAIFLVSKTVTTVKQYQFVGAPGGAINTITVNGSGEAFAIPDIARVSFTISKTEKAVQDAQQNVASITADALAVLKKFSINDKDIRTENYSAYPEYESVISTENTCPPKVVTCPPTYNQVLKGYTVSETISVKIRDTKQAGGVVDGLGSVGVTNISGPEYSVDDETQIQSIAREKAIIDARTRAQELAKQLGVRLVRITNFSESSGGTPMYAKMYDTAGAAPTPTSLPSGQNKVTSNVSISYEIR